MPIEYRYRSDFPERLGAIGTRSRAALLLKGYNTATLHSTLNPSIEMALVSLTQSIPAATLLNSPYSGLSFIANYDQLYLFSKRLHGEALIGNGIFEIIIPLYGLLTAALENQIGRYQSRQAPRCSQDTRDSEH